MQLGSYTLDHATGHGPAGLIYSARDATGTEYDIRFLDRAQANAEHWQALQKRLRLVALIKHPALLTPTHVALEHEPPYLVMPKARPWSGTVPLVRSKAIIIELTELLAKAHRLGLTLGGRGELVLYEVGEDNRFVLDLTETVGESERGTEDFADDIARLGDLLLHFFGTIDGTNVGPQAEWIDIVQQMRQTNTDDRPLAEEVAAKFQPIDPYGTVDSSEVQGAAKTNVDNVQPLSLRTPRVGEHLGRFVLQEHLGEGAVGIVFRAEDSSDGRTVAIKVLKPNALASDRARRRFVKEGRLLSVLDTPYVTRLLDVNTDAGIPYIALEFVDGRNLGDLIRTSGAVDEPTALNYIADAARGLAVAHSLGMIHRDVKPDNMMLASDGRVKMTDFGMAREIEQSQSLEITHDGATVGTPLYMAPEQFGSSNIDTRADVYSLGASLFHLLAGRPPFQSSRLPVLAKAIATEDAPSLIKMNAAISTPLATLVARTLAKDPNIRPGDAGLFLEEIERLRSGEQSDISQHPLNPGEVGSVRTYSFTWELRSSPAQVWPHVSNTERLNRAVGMPAARYELIRNPVGGTRRLAHARALVGLKMEWEEHPFEWIEGRRMGILREFRKGPFTWFISTVDLTPAANGGTTLRHTLRVEPRSFVGRLLAPLQMGTVAKKVLGKVYAQIDKAVQSDDPQVDPFEELTQLSATRRRLLTQRIEQLTINGATDEGAQLLYLYLAHAPDQEVARIRPLALANRFGIADSVVIDTCLKAVSAGLLLLQWDIICPLCRIPSGRKNTLRELKDHENCPACDKEFQIDFANAVELVFQAHPEIRRVETGTYCAGGPAHSPHVVAQTRLAPNEKIELDLSLSEGIYRLRGPQLPWTLELRVVPGAAVRRWEIDLAATSADPTIPPFGVGGQRLIIKNNRPHEMVIRVERTAVRNDALTAAKAMSVAAFRELFPGELLNPGQLAPASSVTLLMIEVTGVDSLLAKQGEAQAFQHVQTAFRQIESAIKAEGGTIIKSIGEALLISFAELAPALRAVFALASTAKDFHFRAALHRGLVMVATVDDRLDYFGLTTKLVTRLLNAANADEFLMSATCAGDPEVLPLIQGRTMRMVEVPTAERGTMLACKVGLTP